MQKQKRTSMTLALHLKVFSPPSLYFLSEGGLKCTLFLFSGTSSACLHLFNCIRQVRDWPLWERTSSLSVCFHSRNLPSWTNSHRGIRIRWHLLESQQAEWETDRKMEAFEMWIIYTAAHTFNGDVPSAIGGGDMADLNRRGD